MITTAAEYEASKEFIDKDLEFYDYALTKKMDSYSYNLYLQDTQYYFNYLYEKLEELEDVVNYVETYCQQKIDNLRDTIKTKEILLESNLENYTNTKVISEAVSWDYSPVNRNKDRDDNEIETAERTSDYFITSTSTKSNYNKIKSIIKHSTQDCYSDNIDTCLEDNFYISMYSLEAPETIEENLEIELDDINNFNRIDIDPINCDIELLGVNDDGKYCIKITTNRMRKVLENYDKEVFRDNNLDKISKLDFLYNKDNTVNTNQNNLADLIDEQTNKEYIYNIIQNDNTNTTNTEKGYLRNGYSNE